MRIALNRYLVTLRTASDGLGRVQVELPVSAADECAAAAMAKEQQKTQFYEPRNWFTEQVQLIHTV